MQEISPSHLRQISGGHSFLGASIGAVIAGASFLDASIESGTVISAFGFASAAATGGLTGSIIDDLNAPVELQVATSLLAGVAVGTAVSLLSHIAADSNPLLGCKSKRA